MSFDRSDNFSIDRPSLSCKIFLRYQSKKKKNKNEKRRKNFDRYSRRYKELRDRRTKEEFTYNEATSGQDEIVSRHYSQTIVVHAARVVSRKVSIPVDE